jgi:4-amino-4-deoxy-L-arabinose transferase-like glycosyltransferase
MGTRSEPVPSASRFSDTRNLSFPTILAVFVLVSRILCRGPLYFGDGPEYVASIVAKTYIIQPPGYWLFNRIAGLFSDPVLAITAMNILFSVAGVVVFYYTACLFTGRVQAFLAALAYSTIFYVWFSGEIHSTYASQILFPVATYYVLLCYERDRAARQLCLAALLFAVGAGLRPTDGMFMIPMVLYFALFRMPRRQGLLFLALAGLLCLGWLVPTWLAFRNQASGVQEFTAYVAGVTKKQSVLTGVRMYTVANFVRYALALLVGFWPVLAIAARNAVRQWGDVRIRALVLWIVPGSLFFLLSLISNAPYLNFLTAAILLLAVASPRWMAMTAVWNAIVFLALAPVPSQNLAVNVVNSFVLRCTRGGIQQRYNATLTETQKLGQNE